MGSRVKSDKPDMDNRERIHEFVDAFYSRMLRDEVLAPIFLDVAAIDLEKHLPLIRAYWEKLLLGGRDYRRHTMNIHRELDARRALQRSDFERWLTLFDTTIDALFAGPYTQRAKQTAGRIATNMHNTLNPEAAVAEIEPVASIQVPLPGR